MNKKILVPVYETFIADMETPISIFQKYVGEELGFLLESKDLKDASKGRYSFISKNPFDRLSYLDKEIMLDGKKVETELKFMEYFQEKLRNFEVKNPDKLPFVGGAYGTMAYDIIREFEDIPDNNPDELRVPDSDMFFVKEGVIYDHFHEKITIVVLAEENNVEEAKNRLVEIKKEIFESSVKISFPEKNVGKKPVNANTTRAEYVEMVNKAKKYIVEGDIFQVVLSQRWVMEQDLHPFEVYRVLRSTNPSPYLFYFNFGDYKVAGSSPEMLVEMKEGHIKNCPIAGTRKRGKDREEDIKIAKEMMDDPKERAEHVMLVDLARNDMGRVAKVGSVEVTEFMEVQNYSHVMHIVSLVEGEKAEKETPFSVLGSFLPAGTLSGAPKIRAMEIIDELEKTKRGVYGGAVGYFSFDGNMDTCIAIRTMVIKDNKINMQAGAGITINSEPNAEYDECLNKVKVLIEALGGDYDSFNR